MLFKQNTAIENWGLRLIHSHFAPIEYLSMLMQRTMLESFALDCGYLLEVAINVSQSCIAIVIKMVPINNIWTLPTL